MTQFNRKDIVAVNFRYDGQYPSLHGQNAKVVSVAADSVTVENNAGAKVVVDPTHLDLINSFLDYSDAWANEALDIFKAVLDGRPIQRDSGKDGWKRVKHPELISLDKLLECDYRIEPVQKDDEVIELNGKRYKLID